MFNKFFSSVAKKLNAKLCSSTLNHNSSDVNFRSFLKNRVNNSIYLSPTTANEVEEIIQNFQNDKASDISISILKKCCKFISGHLAGFLNKFMEDGYFPGILKTGKITSIFKKDDPQQYN